MKDMGIKNVKNIDGGIAEWDKLEEHLIINNTIFVFFKIFVCDYSK